MVLVKMRSEPGRRDRSSPEIDEPVQALELAQPVLVSGPQAPASYNPGSLFQETAQRYTFAPRDARRET